MSEQEKKMAEVIREGFPQLSEFDKGYFLAKIEEAAERVQKKEDKNEELEERN
jgi:hypothetical protein